MSGFKRAGAFVVECLCVCVFNAGVPTETGLSADLMCYVCTVLAISLKHTAFYDLSETVCLLLK